MNLSSQFNEVESLPFSVSLGVASKLDMLLDLAEENSAVQALWEASATQETQEQLSQRIALLCAKETDPQYENPFDAALTIYLHLLYSRDKYEGQKAAALISHTPRCFWAYHIAEAILAKDDARTPQVGE